MARLVGEVELFAAGLGLMLYSPQVTSALVPGRDYMPAGAPLREPLRSLVEQQQRVVLLGTGSPGLDYRIRLCRGAIAEQAAANAAAQVRFGLQIEDGKLCLRDGYDAMQWEPTAAHVQCLPIADGYYAVDALWREGDADGPMAIDLYCQPASARVAGDGWPYLEYRVG